jgi:hexosaminidase
MAAISSTLAAQTFTNTLMPQPASITVQSGRLPITTSFTVTAPHLHDPRLDAAIERTLTALTRETSLHLSNTVLFSPSATLTVDVQSPGEPIQSLDEDESYTLDVTPTAATLHAATTVGAIRGLVTLQQLLQSDPSGYYLPALHIEDSPRFRWRGLLIDVSRHFEPVDVIKHNLDAMAAVKLNVFHWHLSDDQGFRIQSKLYPKLTGLGSDGLFYTQDQARDIVAYARARGIRVVPEFDMPGHTRSWFVGYPKLASGPGPYTIRREFGVEDAAMDPTLDSTYQFIDALLGEMATIFPDPYLHIGGDESNGKQWNSNPRIRRFMRAHHIADSAALQTYFNQRLLPIVQQHHKHMVGWDEIFHPGLPKDVVIESWRGAQSLTEAAQQGYQGILAQPYYLDHMDSAKDHYLADPIPSTTTLTPAQQALILGGEATMWGEHVNQFTIDSRIWPRTAAIAERFWSPASVNTPDDMYNRLAVESVRLEAVGLTHLSHQPLALRELAGPSSTPATLSSLNFFASLLQPVTFGQRYRLQHTTQLTPLNELVDAIRPDPPSRHDINRLTHHLLQAPSSDLEARTALQHTFQSWIDAAPAIQSAITSSPRLAAAEPLARQLPALATAGLEAMQYLTAGDPAPAGWKQRNLALIEAAKTPHALVRFTFLPPLEELVKAVK